MFVFYLMLAVMSSNDTILAETELNNSITISPTPSKIPRRVDPMKKGMFSILIIGSSFVAIAIIASILFYIRRPNSDISLSAHSDDVVESLV